MTRFPRLFRFGRSKVNIIATLALTFLFVVSSDSLTHPLIHATYLGLNAPSDTQLDSTSALTWNWAGYLAQTQGVTGVSGSWAVPQVPATSDERNSSIWVGIGGASTKDLIQVGTAQGTVAGGILHAAFLQMLPNPPMPLNLEVHPDDVIAASIGRTGLDSWLVQVTNLTTGEHEARAVVYHSSMSSAEWIVEVPTDTNGTLKQLANFGAVHFQSASAVAANRRIDISSGTRLIMTDGTDDLVHISPGPDGSFDAFFVAHAGR